MNKDDARKTAKLIAQRYGENVEAFRNLRNISQEELGDLSGLSRTTIQKIEGGRGGISANNLARLSLAFGVAPFELLITADRTTKAAVAAEILALDEKGRSLILGLTNVVKQHLGSAADDETAKIG